MKLSRYHILKNINEKEMNFQQKPEDELNNYIESVKQNFSIMKNLFSPADDKLKDDENLNNLNLECKLEKEIEIICKKFNNMLGKTK